MKKLMPLVLAASVFGGMVFAPGVGAVEGFPACKLDFKKKTGGALTESSYKKLTAAQDLIGKEKYNDALVILNEMKTKAEEGSYEYATVMQNLGWIYAAQNQYRKAIDAMQKSNNSGALPAQVVQNSNLNLAQMYFAVDDYNSAIKILQEWFGCEKSPKPEAYLMLSQVYAQTKRMKEAIPPAKKAIELSPNPKESWYQHLLGLYWETEDFKSATEVLKLLVSKFPDQKKYWTQLSGIYARVNDDKNSLAALELAYRQNMLDKESELRQLAALYAYLDIPYKSAEVLEKGIQSTKIPANEKNWNAVGIAWRSAREFDRAIKAFGEAAKFSDVGEYYFLMAEMYCDKEQWKDAVSALQNAFKKGGLKSPGFAYMRLGEAKFHLGAYKEAISAFQAATKYGNTAKAGEQWAKYVADQQQMAEAAKH